MQQRILIIDNYDSFTYNLKHYIEDLNEGYCDVVRNDEIDFSVLHSYDAFVLSPGPGLPEESGDLLKFLNTLMNKEKILGVCLGHQAMAIATGGRLKQLNTVMHGLQRKCYIKKSHPLLKDIPNEFDAARYHSWVVDRNYLPACWDVLSTDADEEVMIMQHHDLKLTGVQFHPESILTPVGRKLLQNWMAM